MPLSLLSARVLCVRPIGVTSDYCPVCRQERRFYLAQAERKRYFLCFDQGREGQPHHELTCQVCACRVVRPAEERPIEVFPDPKSVGTNEPTMLPIVRSRIADCTAMEEALRAGRLRAEDREEMIRNAMFGFAKIYDEEPFERIKPWVMMLISITIVTVAVLGVLAMRSAGTLVPIYLAGLAIVLIIAALLFWVTKHSPRKRVRTWLATALLPIDPTREELTHARHEMQASRIKAGYAIRSDKLLAKVKKMRAGV